MRITFCFLLIFSFSTEFFGQEEIFEDQNYFEALESLENGELLLIHFFGTNCVECDDIAFQSLGNPFVVKKMDQLKKIKLHQDSIDTKYVMRKHRLRYIPTTLVINKNEDFIGLMPGSSSNALAYEDFIDEALGNVDAPPFRQYKDIIVDTINDREYLREYIEHLKEFGLDYSDALDVYTNTLTIKEITQQEEPFLYLFEHGPIIRSHTYDIMYNWAREAKNGWFRRNQDNRKAVKFNNRIINNTIREAIFRNSEYLARRVADFAKETWSNDTIRGNLSYLSNLKKFAFETNNTELFQETVDKLYSDHYKDINIDSLRREEMGSANVARIKPNTTGPKLNSLAWEIFQIAESDELLEIGLKLSQLSLDYVRDPAFLDTYAHLLYQLGRSEEALKYQKEAIDMFKRSGAPFIPESILKDYDLMSEGAPLRRL